MGVSAGGPQAVIVAAARSPIGRAYKGSLRDMRPDDLAAQLVRAALDQVPALDPGEIDDLQMGCGQPAGEQGYGLGRAVAVLLGLDAVPGATVQRYCASSLQTTRTAAHAIRVGEADVVVSAGVECVSRYARGKSDGMPDTRNPVFAEATECTERRRVDGEPWKDPRLDGHLPDLYVAMGETAENVAGLCRVSRAAQDEFAALSQNRAEASIASGFFARDITPVTLPDGSVVVADDGPRAGVTVEKLAGLAPVFREDGTVTAGNCCPLNDGAAALVLMSDTRAAELGITPLARVVATGVSALSPEIMGLGPVAAVERALAHAGMTIGDVDLMEVNEAFAAQVLPCLDKIEVGVDRVNVHGGAIALGHPFGQTGARLTTTLLHGLQDADAEVGVVTMCAAGGQGMALVIERVG
ncbi:acetyl-CoA C-acetyltransferase [Pseudonocardia aurantiaca]|uniref:acetyl-CoA C-acyltransferase n=1 Tax=Pseudonocardia aurantiaca TaxID=75290 RepID=A0ABW4FQS0_9PSEU